MAPSACRKDASLFRRSMPADDAGPTPIAGVYDGQSHFAIHWPAILSHGSHFTPKKPLIVLFQDVSWSTAIHSHDDDEAGAAARPIFDWPTRATSRQAIKAQRLATTEKAISQMTPARSGGRSARRWPASKAWHSRATAFTARPLLFSRRAMPRAHATPRQRAWLAYYDYAA